MGHNGSKAGSFKTQLPLEEELQWAHSYPRNNSRYSQHKVLPSETITKKLKTTNNGEILQSGGTLTGRYSQTLPLERERRSFKLFRKSSSSSSPSDHYENDGPSSLHIPQHWSAFRCTPNRYEHKQLQREQMKTFGSEPDLRNPMSSNQMAKDRYKAKKKYKAPAPPNSHVNSNGDTAEPVAKLHTRLYKTKMELSQKSSLIKPKYSRELMNDEGPHDFANLHHTVQTKFDYNRLSMPEMRRIASVPNFQLELKETIQRIRNGNVEKDDMCEIQSNPSDKIAKNKLEALDHNAELQLKLSDTDYHRTTKPSLVKEPPLERIHAQEIHKETPTKSFYFGMEQKQNCIDSVVDHFASTLLPYNSYNTTNMESDISSELEMDDSQVSSSGIALQLRPILPKKQLEIPRFSPAVAWKLLAAVESNFATSTVASDEGPVFVEDKIEKFSRPPPPLLQHAGPRSNYDKSGDSGISGDAGPAGFDDGPDALVENIRNNLQLPSVFNRSQGISWTPQQDLGEDESSTDEELQEKVNSRDSVPVKFSPRSNIFSLSLPRENHFSAYAANKNVPQSYVGLQKLKRSVSGVLNGLNIKKDIMQVNAQYQSENWFLSKSAPNSINNGFNSLEVRSWRKSEEIDRSSQNMSRVMYLPESRITHPNKDEVCKRINSRDDKQGKSRSAERKEISLRRHILSKSCENISMTPRPTPERLSLQDPPLNNDPTEISSKKPKRFTFQSTIRQIERKRLAEKLSREAEKKEKQRLSELAAMQKVEAEFQKKRAREKASIRKQLRLFSLDDTSWTSLPTHLEIKDGIITRSDPDGVISSSASTVSLPSAESKSKHGDVAKIRRQRRLSPASNSSDNPRRTPLTQILSEYHQPQREYKDFRCSPGVMGDLNETNFPKYTTVYPQITCDMPKVTGQQGSGERQGSNYRKQFAHGVKTNRSGGSSYSDDSQKYFSPKVHLKKTSISRY